VDIGASGVGFDGRVFGEREREREREREFICQINKQIKQIQISTVAGYQ